VNEVATDLRAKFMLNRISAQAFPGFIKVIDRKANRNIFGRDQFMIGGMQAYHNSWSRNLTK
jgi:hypothetical protein